MLKEIESQAKLVINEFIEKSGIKSGEILVIGCSSSEITGKKIGSDSSVEAAKAVFDAVYPILKEKGIYLAAQCCEHLNRALILEHEAAEKYFLDEVSAVPQPKAGGSFATAAYEAFEQPLTVESLNFKAAAGIDIGGTLIGMHLKAVAVPLRLTIDKIGEAAIICAKTRPKFIGGCRTSY